MERRPRAVEARRGTPGQARGGFGIVFKLFIGIEKSKRVLSLFKCRMRVLGKAVAFMQGRSILMSCADRF